MKLQTLLCMKAFAAFDNDFSEATDIIGQKLWAALSQTNKNGMLMASSDRRAFRTQQSGRPPHNICGTRGVASYCTSCYAIKLVG